MRLYAFIGLVIPVLCSSGTISPSVVATTTATVLYIPADTEGEKPKPPKRVTLDDVRRAWKIHGRLVCHVEE